MAKIAGIAITINNRLQTIYKSQNEVMDEMESIRVFLSSIDELEAIESDPIIYEVVALGLNFKSIGNINAPYIKMAFNKALQDKQLEYENYQNAVSDCLKDLDLLDDVGNTSKMAELMNKYEVSKQMF